MIGVINQNGKRARAMLALMTQPLLSIGCSGSPSAWRAASAREAAAPRIADLGLVDHGLRLSVQSELSVSNQIQGSSDLN